MVQRILSGMISLSGVLISCSSSMTEAKKHTVCRTDGCATSAASVTDEHRCAQQWRGTSASVRARRLQGGKYGLTPAPFR